MHSCEPSQGRRAAFSSATSERSRWSYAAGYTIWGAVGPELMTKAARVVAENGGYIEMAKTFDFLPIHWKKVWCSNVGNR